MNTREEAASASWITYEYEKDMFRSLLSYFVRNRSEFSALPQPIRFAIVESLMLHTRIIADMLLSRDKSPDTIRLTDLLPDFMPSGLDELAKAYGSGSIKDSPCWIINKMLAHPTTERLSSFDYSPIINSLGPLIESVFAEVEAERLKRDSV